MELMDKLKILADSAKYDAACTSSGSAPKNTGGKGIGNVASGGICHSFTADGRCISLLKVLLTNVCVYDCKYCLNRASNDIQRAAFTPKELANMTMAFYRRNYIEGLFLSSGVIKNPDYTVEQMIKTLEILRNDYQFHGYIHSKAIPGANPILIEKLGYLSDRMSVNIELPSEKSLKLLAPNKSKGNILTPMEQIAKGVKENTKALTLYKKAKAFVPAGQSTQMIIGASPETDFQMIKLAKGLYKKFDLKRVFYSAYIPAVEDSFLPSIDSKPPLLREHRLYQADWLMRMYYFEPEEILSEKHPYFHPFLDPKANWAINHLEHFPVDVHQATLAQLLRVPGIGPTSARRILVARRENSLTLMALKKLGVVIKRAQYFVITKDMPLGLKGNKPQTTRALIDPKAFAFGQEQLNLFTSFPQLEGVLQEKNENKQWLALQEAITWQGTA